MGAQIWVCIEGDALVPFLNELRARKIFCKGQRCSSNRLRARIHAGQLHALDQLAAEYHLAVTVERKKGLRFHFYRVKYRWGLIGGLLLFSAILFYFSNTIVSIEINGNETIPTAAMEEALAEVGIERGAFLPALNLRNCELDVRLLIPELNWVGIRHTNGRVVVDLTEATRPPQKIAAHIPTNLVATKTAYLETVQCYDGDIIHNSGDTVKAGDLILSGIRSDELGNVTLHHADGIAIGVYRESAELFQPYVEELRLTEDAVSRTDLLFFGRRIALPGSDPVTSDYAYEEYESPFCILGHAIPIGLLHKTYQPYRYEIRSYSYDEAQALLTKQQARYEAAMYTDCEILDRKLTYSEEENGLRCQISYVIRGEIGAIREIFIK